MWKFKIGTVCVITGMVAGLTVFILILFGFGASDKTQALIAMVLLGVTLVAIIVYSMVEIIWLVFFRKKRISLEKDIANDIAEKLRSQINEWNNFGKNVCLNILVSSVGRGFVVEIWKAGSIVMFVRVSLGYLVRHYALNVPRGNARINRYFFFAYGGELLSEAKKEMGFLVGIC